MLRGLGTAAFTAALLPAGSSASRRQAGARPVDIRTQPIAAFSLTDRERRDFGPLRFLGGLQLSAPDEDFGGFSSLQMLDAHGRFLALSDKATFLTGRLRQEHGRPAGIEGARMAPALGAGGVPLREGPAFDTESMVLEGGVLHVGVERVNRILRFDFAGRGLAAEGRPVAVPAALSRLPRNKGIEALGVMPEGSASPGSLIAIAERSGGIDAPTLGFLIGGSHPGRFHVLRRDRFDVTDLGFLPGGDMLLLERRFTWFTGVAMRLRRIRRDAIRDGATLDGETLLTADMGYEIDNMEGLAISRDGAGRVLLTLISDDNFSALQRTILLQFLWLG